MESKKVEFIETELNGSFQGLRWAGWGKQEDSGEAKQTSRYKMSSSGYLMQSMVITVNNTVLYT